MNGVQTRLPYSVTGADRVTSNACEPFCPVLSRSRPSPFVPGCSPDAIRLAVMMYVRYPLSLRQAEGLLFERGLYICHETVRFWWNRFGSVFAAEIRKRRAG